MIPLNAKLDQYLFMEEQANMNHESHSNTALTTPENTQGKSRRSSLLGSLLSPKNKNVDLSFNTEDLSGELSGELSANLWGLGMTQNPAPTTNTSLSSASNLSAGLSNSSSPLPHLNQQQHAVQQQTNTILNNNYGFNYSYQQQPNEGFQLLNNRKGSLDVPMKTNSDQLISPIWAGTQGPGNNNTLSSSPPYLGLNQMNSNQRYNSIDNSMFDGHQHLLGPQFQNPSLQQNQQHPQHSAPPPQLRQSFASPTMPNWQPNSFSSNVPPHQFQPQQQVPAPSSSSYSRRPSLDANGGFINEYQGIEPHQPAVQVYKSDESMRASYKSIDSYFTIDQYNRISIKSYSEEYMSKLFEELLDSGAQLPRFTGNHFTSSQLMLIAFKAGRIDVFVLPTESKLEIQEGDLVIVEADRGCDLGKVVRLNVSLDEARLLKYLQHQEQQAALASFDHAGSNGNFGSQLPSGLSMGNTGNNLPSLHFPKPILRLAMSNEAIQLTNKNSDEEKAKKICSLKVQSLNLSMCVIDAEYQSDRRKLTFYYNAVHRIDFRDLVRDLFRIYKTRIWMCAVNSDISPEVAGELLQNQLPSFSGTTCTSKDDVKPTSYPSKSDSGYKTSVGAQSDSVSPPQAFASRPLGYEAQSSSTLPISFLPLHAETRQINSPGINGLNSHHNNNASVQPGNGLDSSAFVPRSQGSCQWSYQW